MRYIALHEQDKACLIDWIKKSNEILQELKAEPDSKKRSVIIYKNRTHWREHGLLEFLKGLSHGKCWYTEAYFSAEYPHIEHFRPKSCARNEHWQRCHDGYWWLAFDIDNYRLSKPMPNTRKGTYFPLRERSQAVCGPGRAVSRETPMFIDPTDQQDTQLISFNSLGYPEPCPDPPLELDEWDKQRIQFSIRRYGLDDTDLCDRRKALWLSIDSLLTEWAKCGLKAKREDCKESKGKASQIIKEIGQRLQPDKEFTAVVTACLMSNKIGRSLYPQLISYAA